MISEVSWFEDWLEDWYYSNLYTGEARFGLRNILGCTFRYGSFSTGVEFLFGNIGLGADPDQRISSNCIRLSIGAAF